MITIMIRLTVGLFLLNSGCNSRLGHAYSRNYITGSVPQNVVEKLEIGQDSTFVRTQYSDKYANDKIDSVIIRGSISYLGNRSFLFTEDETNKQFCLRKIGKQLYFFDCSLGRWSLYHHPFLINNTKLP